jgi:hypothetical protein
MRVTWLEDYHYKGVPFAAGDRLTMPDHEAKDYLKRGKVRVVVEDGETAAVAAPETAVRRRGRSKQVAADASETDAKRSTH